MPIRDLTGGERAGSSNPYAAFAPKPKPAAKKKGNPIVGALKSFGGTALKALTVPGAVVVTGVNAATGGDVEWSDLGGAFTNKDGKGAGYKLAKRFGLSDTAAKWAGLAPEILLDPLTYMSGGLSASAKVAGTAGRAAKYASRVDALADLKRLERAAVRIAGPNAAKVVMKGGDLGAMGLSPKKVEQLTRVTRRANRARRELETMGGVPALRMGVGKKTVTVGTGKSAVEVRVPRGLEVRFGSKARFGRDAAKGGKFRQSPLAKEAQRNARVVAALSDVSEAVQTAALKAHNITPEELHYVQNYLALKAQLPSKKVLASGVTGPKLAAAERQRLIDTGKWRPELDAVAEVYTKIDRESASVLGLKRYEDQLDEFGQVVGSASAKVAENDAAKTAEAAAAKTAAQSAKVDIADRARRIGGANAAPLRMALDELDARIAKVPADDPTLAALKSERKQLAKRLRSAENPKTLRDATKAVDKDLASTLARIEARYNPETVYSEAAERFAVSARLGGFAKPWGIKDKGPTAFADLEDAAAKLATVEGHFTTGAAPEMMRAVAQHRGMQLAQGVREPHLKTAFDARGIPDVRMPKRFTSPVNWTTETRFIERMVADGVPEDVANRTANMWRQLGQKFADEGKDLWSKTTIQNLPDVDFFRVQRQGQYAAGLKALEKHTEDLIKEAFPELDKTGVRAMLADIAGKWDKVSSELPTSMRSVFTAKRGAAAGESRFAIGTTWLKLWYTAFNPIGHYTLNATGSLLNSFFEGNRYHLSRGFLGAFGFATRKLGKMDPAAMEKVYKVGKREVTGLEALVMSSLSGLGAPYSRGEIANVIHLMDDTKMGPHRWLAKHLNNFQMDRENADRLYSFLNHMRGGDDMFTAGSKVVRYAFDYDQLTAFEKVWMRNLLIFYTWFRKNLTFQGYGLLTRPGIHATLADVEAARPKYPGEPEWWSKAGGIGTPMGLLTFGNPYADVFKYSADLGDARRTVMSSLNPFIKLPAELAIDRDFFTGAPIGIEREGGLAPGLGHVGKALMGPQGKFVQTVIDDPKPGKNKTVDALGRFFGPKIQQYDHAGNAARLAREEAEARPKDPKRVEAAKKAAETRRKNQLKRYAESGGPTS